jgi:hypothetical protein
MSIGPYEFEDDNKNGSLTVYEWLTDPETGKKKPCPIIELNYSYRDDEEWLERASSWLRYAVNLMNERTAGPWFSENEYEAVCEELQAANQRIAELVKLLECYRGDKAFGAMYEALRLVWNSIDRVNHPAARAVQAALVKAEGRS